MARLVAIDGAIHEIGHGKTTMGRSVKDDITLDDPKISRHHAHILFDGQRYSIIDNLSLNGTYVNDVKIEKAFLNDGDRIRIGRFLFRFVTTEVHRERSDSEGDTVFQLTRSLENVRARQDEETGGGLTARLKDIPRDPVVLAESYRNLHIIQRLSKVINNTLFIDRQIAMAAEVVLDSLPGRMVSISLISEEDGTLKPEVVRVRDGETAPNHAYLKSIADRVMREEVCVSTINPAAEPGENDDLASSAMAAPLWVQDKVMGLLYVENGPGRKPYTEAELDLLISMAGTIAPAVHNARLYRQVWDALRQIKRQQQQLIQSERMAGIGAIAAGLAHKITNPISGIIAMAEGVLECDSIEKARKFAEGALRYAEQTSRIIHDMQSYTVANPEGPLGPISVDDVIDKAIEMCENSGLLGGVSIRRMKGDITYIMGEASQLRQAVLNIIQNAVEAMEHNGTLTISTELEDDTVVARFTDTGPGIPDGQTDRVFEPFVSLRGENRGTGLGLSVCASIVRGFGGFMSCESTVGKGATFTMKFPSGRAVPDSRNGANPPDEHI